MRNYHDRGGEQESDLVGENSLNLSENKFIRSPRSKSHKFSPLKMSQSLIKEPISKI